MIELFEKIRDLDPAQTNVLMTVLDDGALGEKALFADGALVWTNAPEGFFVQNAAQVGALKETEVVKVGGTWVFSELLGQEETLVVCGGGHVAIPIIQIGRMVGFRVIDIDDREQFAANARAAGADEVLCMPYEEAIAQIESNDDTYYAIVTRGHRFDRECLQAALQKRHAYVGMIGSKRHAIEVKQAVLEAGADPEAVARVATPIGLQIGAETPAEIAVSILAQIIEVKNRRHRNCGFTKEMLAAILDGDAAGEPKVLATIVTRKGSAPREVGAKMLVRPDGSIVGTVGGGSGEGGVIRLSLELLQDPEHETVLRHIELSGNDAVAEGMICGGAVDVLLEKI